MVSASADDQNVVDLVGLVDIQSSLCKGGTQARYHREGAVAVAVTVAVAVVELWCYLGLDSMMMLRHGHVQALPVDH